MRQKGIILIPLIVAIATVVVLSTATLFLATDKIQVPGFLKQSFSPLIKETEKLGEPEGLKIYHVTGTTEGTEVEMPSLDISSEGGIWGWLKEMMFSPGYFKKMETPGQGEGMGEGEFYEQQTMQEVIFPSRTETRCSWEITREDLEKLELHCSQIVGYYYGPAIVGTSSDKYDCNPVPGCQHDPEIVPFETKEECESVCGGK